MKYDYVFKLNCVELYKNGRWHETLEALQDVVLLVISGNGPEL